MVHVNVVVVTQPYQKNDMPCMDELELHGVFLGLVLKMDVITSVSNICCNQNTYGHGQIKNV